MTWDTAIKAIKASSPDARVYIGCDSYRYKKRGKPGWRARYSVVVVLHHPRDGCSIFYNSEIREDYGDLMKRLLTEVELAVNAATEIVDHLGGRNLEIHLDINESPKHKSHIAVQAARGWVRGMFGFDPKLKPDSWAGTHVSDHYAREKHKL